MFGKLDHPDHNLYSVSYHKSCILHTDFLVGHVLESTERDPLILQFGDDLVRETFLELLEGMLKGPLLVLHRLAECEQSRRHDREALA